MIYREYGKTGKKLSLLGFGGMRFARVDDHEECVAMMLDAAKGGVNYFDTAPGYFETRSETVFGKGFAEMRRLGLPYYSATKTYKSNEKELRLEVEGQLKRLNIPAIDFYHVWCVTTADDWQERKRGGVLAAFRKLKDEGLVRHICVSSHLTGSGIEELLMEGVFEGVLFGYSAYNFKTREAAFKAIRARKLGAVVMNPLGGGVIPQHPERYAYLKRQGVEAGPGQSPGGVVADALGFLWDHRDITVTLVGFQSGAQVKEALDAMEHYRPRSEAELAEVKKLSSASMEGICTGCGYCDSCPKGIPVPKFMDTYNQKLFAKKPGPSVFTDRLRWHWELDPERARDCVACGQCEKACTQHINIIERLREIAG